LIEAFYDQRLPESITSGAEFERWHAQAERSDPHLLFLSREELMRHEATTVTASLFPKTISLGGLEMALSYHFEPGSARDGATLTVPLYALNQVDRFAASGWFPAC